MASIPNDYAERVYAGVLGKIIGVYVGRPFEGWPHEKIATQLGDIKYYVHEQLGKPLIVTDDDISGTLAFLRAMPDYGNTMALTPAQIGQTWLNYLIEKQTVLWWGGMGNSTEHTAYLRLKSGISAPDSGSIALNGQIVAEQIGAQIFIDGWGMISPGDPDQAADLARRAASVSHDGAAIHGAQVIAAVEAMAFADNDMDALLDVGVGVIPKDCLIRRVINDVREWHAAYDDWHDCFFRIADRYGYDKYGGNCHMVPNHAVIIMALLYAESNFQRAMLVVNTAGWDTDCNSGNVGCIMGIKEGLAGLEAGPDYRGPVADRLYVPTADGGSTVTDALCEAEKIVRSGYALAGRAAPLFKGGRRFHFDMPGAVQGFVTEDSPECRGVATIENVAGHSESGRQSLAIRYRALADGRPCRIQRETYPEYQPTAGYRVVASPTLYPSQMLSARIVADGENSGPVSTALFVKAIGETTSPAIQRSPAQDLAPGNGTILEWRVAAPGGCPIAYVGLELTSPERADGTVYVDWLTWSGTPELALAPSPAAEKAWVQACSSVITSSDHDYRVINDEGVGLLIQGTREWRDYEVEARVTPHMARSFGVAERVQGLERYYALVLSSGGEAALVRALDGNTILARAAMDIDLYRTYALRLQVDGREIMGYVNGQLILQAKDNALQGGGLALLVEEGRVGFDDVRIGAC